MTNRFCWTIANRRPPAVWFLLISICSVSLVTGCAMAKMLLIQSAPTTEKVAPEFNRMVGKHVLVYVWAPPEILWDYPKMRLDVAANVAAYLKQNVEDVTVVSPLRGEAYLEKGSNLEVDPVEVAKHFRADIVVNLAIYKFSMRDPGMAHFYRGRLSSSVVVHDLSQPDEPAERIPLRDVAVVIPEERYIGFSNVRPEQVRQTTYDAFAVEVGKKFHEYEKPVD